MSESASAIFSIADAGEFRFARFYIVYEGVHPADGQATRSEPAIADFFHGRNLSHDTRMDKIMPKEQ